MDEMTFAVVAAVVTATVVALGLWIDTRRPEARTAIAAFTLLVFAGVPGLMLVAALLITDRRPEWWLPVDGAAVLISGVYVFSLFQLL